MSWDLIYEHVWDSRGTHGTTRLSVVLERKRGKQSYACFGLES